MQIGLNTFVLHSLFTDQAMDSFAQIKAWGFDSVEMAVEQPAKVSVGRARDRLRETGLRCGPVCGVFGPGRDLRGSPAEQTAASDYLRRLVEMAAELSAGVVCGPCYSAVGRAELYSPDDRERHLDMVARNLQRACADAKAAGVVIAIEPLNRFETDFINTCAQAKELIRRVGTSHIGIHLDTFHMNIEERSHASAIAEAGSLLAHFHASASHRGVIGEDNVPWADVARALHSAGYTGDVVIETFQREMAVIAAACKLWRPLYDSPESFATRSLRHLRATFAAAAAPLTQPG